MSGDEAQVKDMISRNTHFIRGIQGAAEPRLAVFVPVHQPLLAADDLPQTNGRAQQ